MAFTLEIKTKPFLGNKHIDFKELLKNCGLAYGHDGDFFVLEEGMEDDVAVLYNPKRIGRGITLDMSRLKTGKVVAHYNIPTTPTEIRDFIRLVKELERQMKSVHLYCREERRSYTTKQLEDSMQDMIGFSLEKLNEFCANSEYSSYMFTLAMWPLELTKEMTQRFKECVNLLEFEQVLHEKQNLDVYYAKPRLLQNKDGEIGAFYTFTEECESIFPVQADHFMAYQKIELKDKFVRFYIYSEQTIMDGLYDYDKFIQYFLDRGAEYYDNSHIFLPSMTKAELEQLAQEIV